MHNIQHQHLQIRRKRRIRNQKVKRALLHLHNPLNPRKSARGLLVFIRDHTWYRIKIMSFPVACRLNLHIHNKLLIYIYTIVSNPCRPGIRKQLSGHRPVSIRCCNDSIFIRLLLIAILCK